MDSSHLLAGLVCAVVCAGLGSLVPRLIARVPEPPHEEPEQESSEEEPAPQRLFSTELPPAPPKEPYAEIAATPGLALWSALGCAVVGAAFGARLGWAGALVFLVPLVPLGAALLVIDARTTLLPSWLIKPAYPALVVLILVAALLDRDAHALEGAAGGWLVVGGWFLAFWLATRGGGWGYGDVRLSGLLGLSLGYLGWTEVFLGLFLTLLVGAFAGVVVAVARGTLRTRLPYGPYMLAGAVLGIVVGPALATGLGY